jgi:hypothetical protein
MSKNPLNPTDAHQYSPTYQNNIQEVASMYEERETPSSKADDSRSFNGTDQLIERYRENIKNNPDLKDTGNFSER